MRDTVVDAYAGQEETLALRLQGLGVGGILLPQRDLAPGPRAGQRQSGAPRAAADDRDVIEGHFLSALVMPSFMPGIHVYRTARL